MTYDPCTARGDLFVIQPGVDAITGDVFNFGTTDLAVRFGLADSSGLQAVIGGRELDSFLTGQDKVANCTSRYNDYRSQQERFYG